MAVYRDTTATRKIFNLTKKIRAVRGGTGASKTVSILIWCIDYAQTVHNQRIDIVAESYPHLEAGTIYEFKNIMRDRGYWDDKLWNDSKHVYTFETGTTIKFGSYDKFGKAHGPRRDVLFINECNYIPYDIADQLMARTGNIVWLDWNPTNQFWYNDKMLGNPDMAKDIDELKLTYLDNEALDEGYKQRIESRKSNKMWWQVYGLGEWGQLENQIYKDWQIMDETELPRFARLERYGLDFGYSNDPTAIVAVYYADGGYILDEVTFLKGLSNKQIADIFHNQPSALIIADSAEPKSIDELRGHGLNILPTEKGKDSVSHGIQLVQEQKIVVTKRSINIIKEYRNYLWETDKNGKILNVPEHMFSHSMDAIRYALTSLKQYQPAKQVAASAPLAAYYPDIGL